MVILTSSFYVAVSDKYCSFFIVDLAIHPNFVFVQYDNIESSLSAIAKLDKSLFKGQTICKLTF